MKMQIDKIIKREIFSLSISLILIFIMFLSVSFSSFLTVDESEDDTINIGDIAFSFCRDVSCNSTISNYGQTIGLQTNGGVSSAAKVYPYQTLSEALNQTPYIFTIKNTGDLNLYVNVYLEENTDFIPASTYSDYTRTTELYANNIKIGISRCDNGTINKTNVVIKSYGELNDNKLLQNQILDENSSNTYCLWTWLDGETPNDVQSTYFVANLNLDGNYYPKGIESRVCENTSISDCLVNNYEIFGLTPIAHDITGVQDYITTDYVYQGATPNNYITFNNEDWRVMGVYKTKTSTDDTNPEYRAKIIRNESIGNKYWNKTKDPNHDYNYWDTSTLKNELNSLSVASNSLIDTAVWYVNPTKLNLYGNEVYTQERAGLTSNAKVGLMYPSDYGYASSGCYNNVQTLNNYGNPTCKNSNWLYCGVDEWTIAPSANLSDYALHVYTNGNVYYYNSVYFFTIGVRPVAYLKTSVLYSSGTGSDGAKFNVVTGE